MEKSIVKAVNKANIVVNEEQIQRIIDRIGVEAANENSSHGAPHWKILRELRLEEIDSIIGNAEVHSKYLLWGPASHGTISPITTGGAFYVRIVLTKDKIYSFSFDQLFRKVANYEKPLSEIDKVRQGKAGAGFVLPYDTVQIRFKDRNNITVIAKGEYSRTDLRDLVNDFKDLGLDFIEYNKFD